MVGFGMDEYCFEPGPTGIIRKKHDALKPKTVIP